MYISTTHLAGGWCWGASHQRSPAVGARGAADQALAEAVGVEHVSARRDPRHVHRLQAHRTRGPRLLQLLLTRTRDTRHPALRWSPGWAVWRPGAPGSPARGGRAPPSWAWWRARRGWCRRRGWPAAAAGARPARRAAGWAGGGYTLHGHRMGTQYRTHLVRMHTSLTNRGM